MKQCFEQELNKYKGITTLTGLSISMIAFSEIFIVRICIFLQTLFVICTLCLLVCCLRMYDQLRKAAAPVKRNLFTCVMTYLVGFLTGAAMFLCCLNLLIAPWLKSIILFIGSVFILRLPVRKLYLKSDIREEYV